MFKINKTIGGNIQILGLIFFIFYGILALVFFKERMLWVDSAAFSLEVIQTKTFFTPLGRWGSVFSQVLPLLFLKMGCSLATYLKVYSVGLILLSYLGFLIITLPLKSKRIGLVYLLTLCLTYRNTFYFSISEFSQGLALVVLLSAMLEYLFIAEVKRKTLVFVLSFVLITSLYFFHQLLVIGILFVIIVTYFKHQDYKNKELLTLFLFTLLFFGIKMMLLSGDSYEGKKIPGLAIFIQEIPRFFDLPSVKYFYFHLKTELVIPFLIGLICLFLLWSKKNFLLLALFICYPIAYFVLIAITYYKGEAPNMYQQYYIMFGLFLAFLMNTVWEKEVNRKYIFVIILPILLYSSHRIYASHRILTKRVAYIRMIAQKGRAFKSRKYIIHPDDFSWGYGWVAWALPSEVLLVSSLESKENGVVCYVPGFNEVVDTSSNEGQLLSAPWQQHLLNTTRLDTHFFSIPISTNYLLTNRLKRGENFYKSQIRYNFEWKAKEKKKAKERDISLEEMIQIDAAYLVNTVKEEKLEQVKIKE